MTDNTPALQSVKSIFEKIKHTTNDGTEYWLARELSTALEYSNWQSFADLISRARVAIENTDIPVENHFMDIRKMVSIGYGNAREIDDVRLTRYACYVIAMNGNPTIKKRVAEAQSYFAVQTRRQELYAEYAEDMKRLAVRQEFSIADKALSNTVMETGVHPRGLAEVKSEGDREFFGGNSTRDMKTKYGIENPKTPWANRAPNVVLAGKTLANEMTASNIETRGISTFPAILEENKDNNKLVRKALLDGGIVPEDHPPAEDTEAIKKRVKRIGKISPKQELPD